MSDSKIHESWEETFNKSLKLASLIRADCAAGHEEFDYMVVVPRGGYFPANIVARQLNFGVLDLLHACVGSYESGENNRNNDLVIGDMPSEDKIKGKKLLVIDEVCDTGETLNFLVNYLKDHQAREVKSGVLHYKPANSVNGYKPDWYVTQTDQWIVYPWEEMEF